MTRSFCRSTIGLCRVTEGSCRATLSFRWEAEVFRTLKPKLRDRVKGGLAAEPLLTAARLGRAVFQSKFLAGRLVSVASRAENEVRESLSVASTSDNEAGWRLSVVRNENDEAG